MRQNKRRFSSFFLFALDRLAALLTLRRCARCCARCCACCPARRWSWWPPRRRRGAERSLRCPASPAATSRGRCAPPRDPSNTHSDTLSLTPPLPLRCALLRQASAGSLNTGSDFGTWAIGPSSSLVRNGTFQGVVPFLQPAFASADDARAQVSADPERSAAARAVLVPAAAAVGVGEPPQDFPSRLSNETLAAVRQPHSVSLTVQCRRRPPPPAASVCFLRSSATSRAPAPVSADGSRWSSADWSAFLTADRFTQLSAASCDRSLDPCAQLLAAAAAVNASTTLPVREVLFRVNAATGALPTVRVYRNRALVRRIDYARQAYIDPRNYSAFLASVIADPRTAPRGQYERPPDSLVLPLFVSVAGEKVDLAVFTESGGRLGGGIETNSDLWFWKLPCPRESFARFSLRGTAAPPRPAFSLTGGPQLLAVGHFGGTDYLDWFQARQRTRGPNSPHNQSTTSRRAAQPHLSPHLGVSVSLPLGVHQHGGLSDVRPQRHVWDRRSEGARDGASETGAQIVLRRIPLCVRPHRSSPRHRFHLRPAPPLRLHAPSLSLCRSKSLSFPRLTHVSSSRRRRRQVLTALTVTVSFAPARGAGRMWAVEGVRGAYGGSAPYPPTYPPTLPVHPPLCACAPSRSMELK